MAFEVNKYGGYGSGTNGAVTDPSGQVNSYANVLDYDSSTVTIDTPSVGAYENFTVGTQVLLHVSATNGTSTETTHLGKYMVATITAVGESGGHTVLTIDKDFTAEMAASNLSKYQMQVITIAEFTTLTVESGNVSPIAYSTANGYGGILAIKCSESLTLAGGNILLDGLGIPVADTGYRPATTQETQGLADTDTYAGWENHITVRNFLLSCGCGAALIMAKAMNVTATTGYIGGNGGDAQYQRGNRTGGASILIAADTVTGFDPKIIDCSYGSGVGLGRCYIASKEAVQGGFEGIFAADVISDKTRVMKSLGIKGYGDGSNGVITNPTDPLNNYACVTGVNRLGNLVSINNATANNAPAFTAGTLVMFHISKPVGNEVSKMGKFQFFKIIAVEDDTVTLDRSVNDLIDYSEVGEVYDCQLITVPQATEVTISTNYSATTAWDATLKRGGIFACVCSGTFDLTDGQINVENKGGGNTYSTIAMTINGNSQCADKLPLGSGHGSVFILAKELVENSSSRIGATYTGNALGGAGGQGARGNSGSSGSVNPGDNGGNGGAGYGGGGHGGNSGHGIYSGQGGKGGNGSYGGNGGAASKGGNSGYVNYQGRSGVNGGNGYFGGIGGDAGNTSNANSGRNDGYTGGKGGNGYYGGKGGNGGNGGDPIGNSSGEGGSSGGNGYYGGIGGNGGNGGGCAGASGNNGGYPGAAGNGYYGGIGGNAGAGGSGSPSSSGSSGGNGGTGGNGYYGARGGNGTDGSAGIHGKKGADNTGSITTFPEFMTVLIPSSTASSPYQGAHVILIADNLTNPSISALSTGGPGGIASTSTPAGRPGWAFIYCNHVTDENTSGVVVA